jgi:RND family efflux transporter MFP subunit
MKFKFVITIALAFLLLTSAVFGVPQEAAKADEKPVKCPKRVGVLVQDVKPATFKEFKRLKIAVLPGKVVDTATPFAGAVKTIEKAVGSEVKAGDVILKLDTAAIQYEIDEAQAQVKRWQRNLFKRERWKVRSPRAEAQAKGNIKKNQELVAEKEAQMSKCTITAPISGVITALKVKEGDRVSQDFDLFSISNTEKVIIPLGRFAEKVEQGQAVRVKIKELSKAFKGSVYKADESYIVIDNAMLEIKSGMMARFRVLMETHENVVVLAKARILKDDSGMFVYVVNGKLARKAMLKIGAVEKGRALIKDGLKTGDELIVAEVLKSKDGTLRDEFTCLDDAKKIKIMVMDEVKGKYVKRKKGAKSPAVPVMAKKKKPVEPKPEPEKVKKKEVKKKEIKKKPRRKLPPLPSDKKMKFRVGAHLVYTKMSNQDFEDVYGRMVSFGLNLSYFITDNIDIWLSYGSGKKEGVIPDFPEVALDFAYTPISIDLRYYFKRSPKFDFFAGLGLNHYSYEENISDELDLESVKDTAIGFNMLGGMYYNISANFSLQCLLRWNAVKKTIIEPAVDNELNLGGLELLFGITYGF